MSDVDWRAVLSKYMDHVTENEGVTFLEYYGRDHPASFTDAEWAALKVLERETFS